MIKYFLILLTPLVNGSLRYENYSLYIVTPESEGQLGLLKKLQSDPRFDFWISPSEEFGDANIVTGPAYKGDLENLLNENKIEFKIDVPDIQAAIHNEKIGTYIRGSRNMEWDRYYRNEDINVWLDDLAIAHPQVATLLINGLSVEGRELRGIRISHGEGRRAIVIEGGLHAREWISPAVTCYMIDQLLNGDDEASKAAARDHDWYIFPVTNPDGYVWSHLAPENRMWRKNRRPLANGVFGVDLNRNWNDNWLAIGASTNPEAQNYAGPGPFSEPETRSLSQFIRSVEDRMDIYLSMHSHGQMLLIPFGNSTEPLLNYDEALNIGRRAMGALAVRHNTHYVVGNVAEVLSFATGAADDWVKDTTRAPLVYCYELRDRHGLGSHGFDLPADQIKPSGEETWDSVLDIIFQAKRFGVIDTRIEPESTNSSNLHISSIVLVALSVALAVFLTLN